MVQTFCIILRSHWLQFEYEDNLSVCNEFKSWLLVGSFLHFSYWYSFRPLHDHLSPGCHRRHPVAMEMLIDLSIPLQVGVEKLQGLNVLSICHMKHLFKFKMRTYWTTAWLKLFSFFFNNFDITLFFKLLGSCDMKNTISGQTGCECVEVWNQKPWSIHVTCLSLSNVSKCLTRDTVAVLLLSLGPTAKVKLIPL